MTYPHRPLVALVAVPWIISLGLMIWPERTEWVIAANAGVVLLALIDLATLPRSKRFRADRELESIASLGERHRVTLTIENRSSRDWRIEVRDDVPDGFCAEPDTLDTRIPAKSRARLAYTMTPLQRGSHSLRFVYIRVHSRLGLWQRTFALPLVSLLRVYPDLKQLARYSMYARMNRLSLLGVRRARRIGTDNEFERLREYTPDDNFRHIDWKATGRRRKLIVRDFQTNHNQRVVFLIDAGRMMVNESGGLSLLDRAIDAALMLAHVAAIRGDAVGLLTFSDRVHTWIAPNRTGRRQVHRMVHAVHDLFPRLVESRYDLAFLHLARDCRKRSLVVLVTNLIDDVNANQIEAHVTSLAGRHLPLAVLLRDHEIFDAIPTPPTGPGLTAQRGPRADMGPPLDRWSDTDPALYRAAAAADLLSWRAQVLGRLRRGGALTLDLFPENLSAPLINEYLRIKAMHLL